MAKNFFNLKGMRIQYEKHGLHWNGMSFRGIIILGIVLVAIFGLSQ